MKKIIFFILAHLESQMTDAQRNRQKVLNEEFNLGQQNSHAKSMPDVNLNTLPDEEISELQRNRRRMMHNDLFCEYNKDPLKTRSNLYLNLDSDRARNRQKVLSSEYNILTGQNTADLTPMSTTSDTTPVTEALSETQADKDNGNTNTKITEDLEKHNLKLNVTITSSNSMSQGLTLPTAGTFPEATPDCALNTAGIMAKHGFAFPNANKLNQQQQTASSEGPVNNLSLQQEEACPEPDYSDPYKRCRELIESNFKCKSTSPYIRLNNPTANTQHVTKNLKASVNVTTLTEFLQKSVILPMSTHLELVNNEVMRLFLQDLKVLDHFRSLRNYYFMMDGEFGSIICDGIIGRLEDGVKPDKLLNYQMLHSILDTALGSSITGK